MKALIAPAVMLLMLVGCASGGTDEPADESAGTASDDAPAATSDDMEGFGDIPADLLRAIVVDASERTGATSEEIEVVSAEPAGWNDGSLGCPEPGQLYTQALVDGYRVIIRAGDQELDYRAAHGGVRVCEDAGGPGATKPPG